MAAWREMGSGSISRKIGRFVILITRQECHEACMYLEVDHLYNFQE